MNLAESDLNMVVKYLNIAKWQDGHWISQVKEVWCSKEWRENMLAEFQLEEEGYTVAKIRDLCMYTA